MMLHKLALLVEYFQAMYLIIFYSAEKDGFLEIIDEVTFEYVVHDVYPKISFFIWCFVDSLKSIY